MFEPSICRVDEVIVEFAGGVDVFKGRSVLAYGFKPKGSISIAVAVPFPHVDVSGY